MKQTQSIGQRIKQVRGELSQKAFGARIELSQTAVTALENDQSEPRLGTFNKIVDAFGVNPEWLRTGLGEMKGAAPALTPVAPPPADTTEPEPPRPAGAMWVSPLTPQEIAGLQSEVQHLRRELATANGTIEKLWGQNDTLIKKPSASPDAADLYTTVDAIGSEISMTLATSARPEYRRFTAPVRECVQRSLIGFGREQA